MKKNILALIILCVFILNGCMHQYRPSEQQTEILAEAIAEMVLKYDKNYKTTLISLDVMAKVDEYVNKLMYKDDGQIIIDLGDKASADMASRDTSSKDIGSDGKSIEDVGSNNNSSGDDAVEEVTVDSLSDMFGIDSIEFTYQGYELYDEFPSKLDSYINFTHKEGNQLLIVSFLVHNSGNEKKSLDFSGVDINYILNVNKGIIYKPVMTLLEDDLQFINVEMDADEEKTALLIFEVPKDSVFSEIDLKISKNDKSIKIDME